MQLPNDSSSAIRSDRSTWLRVFVSWFAFGLLTMAAANNSPHSLRAQESGNQSAKGSIPFFIGTYTQGSSQGIYLSSLELETGSLQPARLLAEVENPSFLALHPSLPVLYAVSEVTDSERQVIAYRLDDEGNLTEIDHHSSGGNHPCYVTTSASGDILLIANYSSGTLASFPIQKDGSLGKLTTIAHQGSSVHPRQKGPHAHCIQTDPSGKFACAVDLGLDQVLVYRVDSEANRLGPRHSVTKFTPGSGPRHIAFHPQGQHAFVIHELTCQISTCTWDSERGELEEVQVVSTLPGELQPQYSTAEILVHPNGKFVYGSNRGHHSIAVFQFKDGILTPLGHTSTEGETPRNFRIDPSGRFLLAENQGTDSISVFRINADSGELQFTGNQLTVGAPVCIKFARTLKH